MHEKRLPHLPLAAAALCACMSAQAEYQSPDGNFRMSGFGTIGVVHSSTNDVDFVYPGQAGGAGTTPNTSPDTKIALQGSYRVTSTVSLTSQIMTKYDAYASYEPKIDWLFAKWQVLPAVAVRAGRMGAPFFMISDFRDVGYANTPARPPLDVYSQVPVSQFEGADIAYQFALASTTMNASVYYGNSKSDYSIGLRKTGDPFLLANSPTLQPSSFELKNLLGVNLSAEFDNGLTLRLGHSQSQLSVSSPGIAGTQALAAATGSPSLINAVNAMLKNDDGRRAVFDGIGLTYDQGDWVASAEYTKKHAQNFVADTTGWYVSCGYRIGKLTPYGGLSRLKVDDTNTSNPLTALLTDPGIAGAISRNLQGVLNSQTVSQRTTTLGIRWDAQSNMALKAQLDHITKPAGAYGLFYAKDSGSAQAASFFTNSRRVNVLSVSMDFVF